MTRKGVEVISFVLHQGNSLGGTHWIRLETSGAEKNLRPHQASKLNCVAHRQSLY